MAFDRPTRIAGDAPSVTGNIEFGSHREELGVDGNRTGPSHFTAGGLTYFFILPLERSGSKNRFSIPCALPATAFLTGAVARELHLQHRVGFPHRKRNPMAPRNHQ